jgi:alpha-amylase
MDSFFERLEKESAWLNTVQLGEWLHGHRPSGLCYLPSASYMEMGEWALPPSDQKALHEAKEILTEQGREDLVRFVRGSHWPNFFVRYPESNLMHKRILHLSRDAHAAKNDEALDHIWQAQCNCPFWHGVFGGVYLGHIRDANTGNIAAADALLHPGPRPVDERDWDFDGVPEACLRSGQQTVVVDLEQGEILHWELPGQSWHLTHVVATRPEAYHEDLAHAEDEEDETSNIHDAVRVKDARVLEKPIVYDTRLRLAAQDVPGASNTASWRKQRHLAPTYELQEVTDIAVSWTGSAGTRVFA